MREKLDDTTPEKTQEAVSKKIHKKTRAAIDKKMTALKELKIEYVEIGDISPNPYNPNRQSEHDFELLCSSMREDGFTQPVIVHEKLKQIVDGEHRWRAAQAIGLTEIPVVFVDMSSEQMRISTLRHNRARGSEDLELSAQLLRDLQELGALEHAQDSLLMDDYEVRRLIDDVDAPDALASDLYSEAWLPMPGAEHERSDGTYSDHQTVSMTTEAVEKHRELERNIKKAKSEDERKAVKRDLDVFRLTCVFTGEEAVRVKQVIHGEQAKKLLELCDREIERLGQLDKSGE